MRLSLVNFKSLRRLGKRHNVDIFQIDEVEDDVSPLVAYDQIVVNLIASDRTPPFLDQLVNAIIDCPNPPKLIIGTEYTWASNVKAGRISQELVDWIYHNAIVLRHTARTDRHVYERPEFEDSRVQEFELGIDMDVMPDPLPFEERRGAVVVYAPEGRVTKNNEEIDEFVTALSEMFPGEEFPITEFRPPYTAAEYWEALRASKYLFFTSLGETFSYVLNDALSMGVIGFRRAELYANRTAKFGVDSYFDVGVKYSTVDEAVELVRYLESNPEAARAESERAYLKSRVHFSATAVESKWEDLLTGTNRNDRTLYIADIADLDGGVDSAFMRARDLGASVVMSHLSRGLSAGQISSYSLVSNDRSQVVIPSCFIESGSRFRRVSPNLSFGVFVDGEEERRRDFYDYMRLVIRVHGVSTIFVDKSVVGAVDLSALRELRYLAGHSLMPVHIDVV